MPGHNAENVVGVLLEDDDPDPKQQVLNLLPDTVWNVHITSHRQGGTNQYFKDEETARRYVHWFIARMRMKHPRQLRPADFAPYEIEVKPELVTSLAAGYPVTGPLSAEHHLNQEWPPGTPPP